MIKTALLVAACSFAAFSAGTARTTYSPQQLVAPTGYSIKVTPSATNIWSWYDRITVSPGETVRTNVFIDIDRDGTMDTSNTTVRVFVSDMQVVVSSAPYAVSDGSISAILRDSVGHRWNLTPSSNAYDGASADNRQFIPTSYHLATPLVLPVDSDLRVDITNNVGSMGNLGDRNVDVYLIGQVVNL